MNTKPKQGIGFRIDRGHLMNCDINLSANKEELPCTVSIQTNVASQLRTPQPEELTDVMSREKTNDMLHHISWADAQECVGSARQLGGKNGWSGMRSLVRGASKRLLT